MLSVIITQHTGVNCFSSAGVQLMPEGYTDPHGAAGHLTRVEVNPIKH